MVTVADLNGQLIPIGEAANLLSVHPNTLRRWSDRGIIRAYRLGSLGHRRFMRRDVLDLMVDLRTHGGARPTVLSTHPNRPE